MDTEGNAALRGEWERFARDWQSREGVTELIGLAATKPLPAVTEPPGERDVLSQGPGVGDGRVSRRDGGVHGGDPVHVAARQVTPGALSAHYAIPVCSLRRKEMRGIILTGVMLAAIAARFGLFIDRYPGFWVLDAVIFVPLASMSFQWLLSWRDRPAAVTAATAARLDRLRVVVNVPVYNEDPGLLDRCLFALLGQSRLPQRIDVVDDGSALDYTALRAHWERTWPCGTEVRWFRQANQGKKHAQAVTFSTSDDADVYVVIDSDTCLDRRALEEGLKPFADRSVASVAGIELAMNAAANWLTRTVSVRALFFQMLPCAAQSALGDVLINRGAFFLIRAPVVREYLGAYLGETFWGRPVRLGDDAALTLFARSRGRTVQQGTAFGLTMYPETLSQHLRQWVRWMRGSAIRTCWRLRYLSPATFGWWFTVLGVYSLLVSTAFPVMLGLMWPRSEKAVEYVLLVTLLWGYVYGLRSLAVRRSDQSLAFQAVSLLAYPAVLLWGLLVLRPLRVYGTCTFLRQGWITRVNGAEIALRPELITEGAAA